MLKKVVFPAPFGPMMQWMVPASSVKSMSSLATSPRKRLVRPSVRSNSAMPSSPPHAGRHVGDQPSQAVLEEDDHGDEDEADDQLPVLWRDRAQIVRQRRDDNAADERAEEGEAAAKGDPDDDLGGKQDAGKRR